MYQFSFGSFVCGYLLPFFGEPCLWVAQLLILANVQQVCGVVGFLWVVVYDLAVGRRKGMGASKIIIVNSFIMYLCIKVS